MKIKLWKVFFYFVPNQACKIMEGGGMCCKDLLSHEEACCSMDECRADERPKAAGQPNF